MYLVCNGVMTKSRLVDFLPQRQRDPKNHADGKQVDEGHQVHDAAGVAAYQRLERHTSEHFFFQSALFKVHLRPRG